MAESSGFTQQSSSQSGGGGTVIAWDEMTDPKGGFRPHWQGMSQKIHRWSAEERNALLATGSRMIEDLGTTFNVYSDVAGSAQPYELDPIPLMVSPTDWAQVSAGLVQRTRLIDAVLADIYGPQELLKQGLLPPDLVHSSPAFLQYARSVQPSGGRFLVTTGCDLVRRPDGQWTVLRDHTSAPGGLGQVLENRNVTSSLLSDQFESLRIARLGDFFDLERATLESLVPARHEPPCVVLLTPGFRHPSYFEHAYKARLLGFPLVEPADLTVRERRLFLKTLAGLQRIDVVASRINDNGLDPLEHWGLGGGGVAGMVEAWRSGNVALANAPGAGFANTPALMPFLPGICRKWFGEEIKLSFVETWWLHPTEVRRRVTENLHRYVLLSAFGRDPLLPIRGSSLSPAARKQWIATIEERPYDFVAQLDVTPSVAPSLEARGIRQRPVLWRAFTVNAADGPVTLPGGLAKVGRTAQAPQMWPGHAGFTKDVWIAEGAVGTGRSSSLKTLRRESGRHPAALEVPSRIAEQLFWVGRYLERTELATRLLRVTLRNLAGEAGRLQQQQLAACLTLIRSSGLLPEEVIIHPSLVLRTLSSLIHDEQARGGIPGLTRSLLLNAAAARDRLSDDTWRFFNRLEQVVHSTPESAGTTDLLRTLDNLILHLSAIAGMQAENMTRGQGWRFLEVGRRIERGLGALSLLGAAAGQGSGDASLLQPLLEICDSVMTYRRRHFSRPELEPVVRLIFFDVSNPRSVGYQIGILTHEMSSFPGDPGFGLLPKIRLHLEGLASRFANPSLPSEDEFGEISSSLELFADMVTQHYFSHSVRRVY
ncbi:MAG: circularly permuted type 2 ATP-grasp protein [Verrucomicrobiota bacterium]